MRDRNEIMWTLVDRVVSYTPTVRQESHTATKVQIILVPFNEQPLTGI